MGKIPFIAALILLFAAGAGCTTLRNEMGTSFRGALPTFAHQTHYRDVLEALGPPARMSTLGSDLVFLYEYTDVRESQLGISLNLNIWPTQSMDWLKFFKLTTGRAKARREALVMLFDERGLLRSQQFEARTDDLGGGFGLQILIAAVSVVDTDELEEEPYQHKWGRQLLHGRLPVLLNAQSSLRTGRSGVQQLGTPTGAGQHTLEQHLGRPDSE